MDIVDRDNTTDIDEIELPAKNTCIMNKMPRNMHTHNHVILTRCV